MALSLTSAQVWHALQQEVFAVIGMVTAKQEARTVGVLYLIRDHTLYVITGRDTWKARHIAANPQVSVTVPIAKRIFFMPWLKIPAATITFAGVASVIPATDVSPELRKAILRGTADDAAPVTDSVIIAIKPQGDFLTYGVGVPLMQMRDPKLALGRAPVAE